ncbi:MAG: T9SS type A sorting domain-containing protein [Ignavibacteria bacterium]|nr:T9SS type A sorting domain-containing protein [Ignavibacteria bacterium]
MKTLLMILSFVLCAGTNSQTWQIMPGLPEAQGRYEDLWFINENTGWVVQCGSPDKIFKTTNGGLNFTEQLSVNAGCLRSVAFNNANLGWAGSLGGHLYRTTNGGTNWMRVDTTIFPPPVGVCDISVVGDLTMYGSGKYSGPTNIIKTTDGGITYENIDMGAYSNYQVGIKFMNENTGFVGCRSNIVTEGSVMLYTTDGGNSWSKRYKSFIQSEHVWNIYFVNSLLGYATVERFAAGNGAVIKSTDGGLNWVRINIPGSGNDLDPIGFINANTGWIANHSGFGLRQTTDGGQTWSLINVGSSIHGIFIASDSIAYASGNEFYKYTGAVVGISDPGVNTIPFVNTLEQNYPNPFNPVTNISYKLIQSTNVVLDIYNANGEFAEVLLQTRQGPGSFSVAWDASGYPSGVYFYSLRTDQGNYYGKAVLVK